MLIDRACFFRISLYSSNFFVFLNFLIIKRIITNFICIFAAQIKCYNGF